MVGLSSRPSSWLRRTAFRTTRIRSHVHDHEPSATVARNARARSPRRPPRRAEDRNPGVELGSVRPPVRCDRRIDISPSQVDRPEIYDALQVEEVWWFDGESLTIEQLGPDGKYITSESSRFLPVRTEEVIRWFVEEHVSDRLAWEQRLRAWIRAELVPRMSS